MSQKKKKSTKNLDTYHMKHMREPHTVFWSQYASHSTIFLTYSAHFHKVFSMNS